MPPESNHIVAFQGIPFAQVQEKSQAFTLKAEETLRLRIFYRSHY